MGLFGKSEDELKKWNEELISKEKSLTEKQVTLEHKKSELEIREEISQKIAQELTEKDADLIKRETAIMQRELNAKNNFVKEQRESFKESIDRQRKDLNAMANELTQKQSQMDLKYSELIVLEGDLTKKERKLKEEELKAHNGFAERNKVALREIEMREEACKNIEVTLVKREENINTKYKELENKAERLRQRELLIKEAEIKRDEGFESERKNLDAILSKKRSEYLKDMSTKREQEFNELEKLITKETQSRIAALQNELSTQRKQHESLIQKETADLINSKVELNKEHARIEELRVEIDYQMQRVQSREDNLDAREASLNVEVDAKVIEQKQSFENEKSLLREEIERLRKLIETSSNLISNYEDLKHKLGDEDPATVLLKLKTYEEEIKNLRDDLATRPTQEMQDTFDRLKNEKVELQQACERLSEENGNLRSSARTQSDLEMQLAELSDKNKSLLRRYESVDADNNRLGEELKRLQTSYERKQDREARIEDIESPYITKDLTENPIEGIHELEWLDGINRSCSEYGLKFPRRILHAFHTALKTSEWSPITVLAGVSGTGKSELPRLYSHFGGMNFLSLSVQPNWDSQESMLGFFNSIDNKFDAQPVLRLLAQSQKTKSEEYPFGLEKVMSLILLDEMNLAHIELYFAEFLSKLELRRGLKGNEVPSMEVKLGAGIQHYNLPLGRNVLWAGTMNQDETTKSLSDKVLDRGIVINFPRPTTLERRRQLKPLGEPAPLLSRKLWESWWCKESRFADEQILPLKKFIEEMNISLSKVGRALGHRVWQSIEYYMANYPDVLEAQRVKDDTHLAQAMKIAFEDQLVQKVMPKLRGIETRGKSKSECLDKIRIQLLDNGYSIIDDFDLACEFGYGQFIWNSANYLKDDDSENGLENAEK